MKIFQLLFVSTLRGGSQTPMQSSAGSAVLEHLPTQHKSHLLYLDGLRALCALYVVIHHALTQSRIQSGPVFEFFNLIFCKGHFAVDMFIVLSGFCLMLPVVKNGNTLKGSYLNFVKKRVRRILPTYYLAMAFSLLLIYTLIGDQSGTHWDVSIPVRTGDIISHLLLVQDMFGRTSAKINHAFWSIAVEWRIYFLFPFLIYAFKRWGAIVTTAIALVASVGVWAVIKNFTHFNASPWGMNPHFIGLFSFGMLAASIAYSKLQMARLRRPELLFTLALILLVIAYFVDVYKWALWIGADILVGISCSLILVLLSSDRLPVLNRVLSWKPLAATGVFAYSIYLVHAPLLEVFSRYAIGGLPLSDSAYLFLYLLVGSPLVVMCSYAFFLVAEKPFVTKKQPVQHIPLPDGLAVNPQS